VWRATRAADYVQQFLWCRLRQRYFAPRARVPPCVSYRTERGRDMGHCFHRCPLLIPPSVATGTNFASPGPVPPSRVLFAFLRIAHRCTSGSGVISRLRALGVVAALHLACESTMRSCRISFTGYESRHVMKRRSRRGLAPLDRVSSIRRQHVLHRGEGLVVSPQR
jgi:hypothetical protein